MAKSGHYNLAVTGPIQGQIPNHGTTDDTTPTLRGTAEAGATLVISDGSTVLGSVVVGADGKWSFTPDHPLTDGEHHFSAVAHDAAGNVSAPSASFDLTIITAPPARPIIASVTDNVGDVTGPLIPHGTTDDARPVIAGTAEANSVVFVYDTVFGKHILLGSATTDADGNWSFRPEMSLPEGEHIIDVVARDAAGNESEASNGFDFNVLIGGTPAVPAITGIFDAVEPHVGNIAPNGVTNDARPTVTGTAPAGQTVHVFMDGNEVGTVIVGENGRWSYQPAAALPDGNHTFHATATAADGTQSPATGDYAIVVDTTAPAVSSGESLSDDVGPVTGPISAGGVTDDATPTYRGRAEPGAIVIVYDGDTAIGSTVVGQDGSWTFQPANALTDGAHSLSTTVTDAAGNTSAHSTPIGFTVDTSQLTIAIDSVIDHQGPAQGALSPGQATDDRQPEIQGHATPASLVKVYVDGQEVGSIQAGADGSWSMKLPNALSEGQHAITATSTSASGTSEPSAAFDLVVDITAPNAPVIVDAFDDVGPIRGSVSDHGYTDDTTPTLRGTAEAGATLVVSDGSTMLGSVVVGADGKWSFTPDHPLTDGEHHFSAVAHDAAGNVSAPSASFDLTIDTAPPEKPTLDEILDDFGPITGNIIDKGLTDDSIPQLMGHAEPHSIVIVYSELNGVRMVVGSTIAGEFGDWSITPATDLEDGVYTLTVAATDRAGNVSSLSAPYQLEVDTTAPRPPIITEMVEHAARPELHGTAEAGAIVTVVMSDSQTTLGTALADEHGNWVFQPEQPLPDGMHAIIASATDAAGNPSGFSRPFPIEIAGAGSPAADHLAPDASPDSIVPDASAAHHDAMQAIDSPATASAPGATATIDLNGYAHDELKLSLNDVLQDGAKDWFVDDGRTQLMVKGNEGDTVDLSGSIGTHGGSDWVAQGESIVDGVTYAVYENAAQNAELLVQQGVTTHLM